MRKNRWIISFAAGSLCASLSGMAHAADGIVQESKGSISPVSVSARATNRYPAPMVSAIDKTPELNRASSDSRHESQLELPAESMEFRRLLAPNGIVHEPQLWIRVDTTHETQTLRLASQVVVSDQELFVV